MIDTRRSPWRFGVPLVCLMAGLLLAATHGVSGGAEIRRSDAPRLVDLVREAQSSVSQLNAERDELIGKLDSIHGRSSDTALAAMLRRSAELAGEAGMDPVHGPGLVVTLQDAQRDGNLYAAVSTGVDAPPQCQSVLQLRLCFGRLVQLNQCVADIAQCHCPLFGT